MQVKRIKVSFRLIVNQIRKHVAAAYDDDW